MLIQKFLSNSTFLALTGALLVSASTPSWSMEDDAETPTLTFIGSHLSGDEEATPVLKGNRKAILRKWDGPEKGVYDYKSSLERAKKLLDDRSTPKADGEDL